MKKVLLASTVLAMTATVAAAEVTLSGDARMGILNGFVHNPAIQDNTGFTSRARVKFTLSGETDGGLAFGASFRADNAASAASGLAGSVFISGAFGKLSMGDVDGAAQSAVGHVDGVGLTGLGDLNESTYLAAGGAAANANSVASDPTALYEYSAGAVTVYASVTNPAAFTELVAPIGPSTGDTKSIAYALGAKYSMGDYTVSAGYENASQRTIGGGLPAALRTTHWIIGGDATFGQITVKARYGKADFKTAGVTTSKFTQASLSGTYKMDAIAATMYLSNKQAKNPAGANILKTTAVGLGGSYDLGGGASVVGGIAQQKITVGAAPSTKDTAFDLGVSFSF